MPHVATDGKTYRILLVADTSECAGQVEALLADSKVCPAAVTSVFDSRGAFGEIQSERYDAILLEMPDPPGRGLDLLDALRMVEFRPPVVVLGSHSEQLAQEAIAHGADDYLLRSELNEICLPRHTRHAITRYALAGEKAKLETERQRRLRKEKVEAENVISEQQRIIRELEKRHRDGAPPSDADEPALTQWARREFLKSAYLPLARSYVVMGNQATGERIAGLAVELAAQKVTPTELLNVHLQTVQEMTDGLSHRGAGHVLAQTGTLILELMVRLAQQYMERRSGCSGGSMRVMLVTVDEPTSRSLQTALDQAKLRSHLTIVDSAQVAWETISEDVQGLTGPAPDLIFWDSDTLGSDDVEWIARIAEERGMGACWQVLLSSPGQLPLVPADFPQLATTVTKPMGLDDLLRIITSMPDRWLSICRLTCGQGPEAGPPE